MKSPNRRRHKRFRIPTSPVVTVQIFPVLPFVGHGVRAELENLSLTGMAIVLSAEDARKLASRKRLRVHFRLPGHPFWECRADVRRDEARDDGRRAVALAFSQTPAGFERHLQRMTMDNELC